MALLISVFCSSAAIAALTITLGKQVFDYVWTKFDDREPPEATTQETTWPKVLAAAAVEGIAFKTTRAAVDRYGAKGWYYLTGSWPGERVSDPEE